MNIVTIILQYFTIYITIGEHTQILFLTFNSKVMLSVMSNETEILAKYFLRYAITYLVFV